jgi:hypothetical protein
MKVFTAISDTFIFQLLVFTIHRVRITCVKRESELAQMRVDLAVVENNYFADIREFTPIDPVTPFLAKRLALTDALLGLIIVKPSV